MQHLAGCGKWFNVYIFDRGLGKRKITSDRCSCPGTLLAVWVGLLLTILISFHSKGRSTPSLRQSRRPIRAHTRPTYFSQRDPHRLAQPARFPATAAKKLGDARLAEKTKSFPERPSTPCLQGGQPANPSRPIGFRSIMSATPRSRTSVQLAEIELMGSAENDPSPSPVFTRPHHRPRR